MYLIAQKHQRKIALDILRNQTPMMANILGGMTFNEAYKVIFETDLESRLDQLIKEYGITCKGKKFSWELDVYGWNPVSLNSALGTMHSRGNH